MFAFVGAFLCIFIQPVGDICIETTSNRSFFQEVGAHFSLFLGGGGGVGGPFTPFFF